MFCPACQLEMEDAARSCDRCGHVFRRDTDQIGSSKKILEGKYRLDMLLGEGGMGKVYKATQLTLDKNVAVKVLHHSLLSDENVVARFKQEAKAASRLNHPNSIGIIDFGQDSDGSLFIVMEYVDGKDLQQILAGDGFIEEKRLIRIFAQVLSALADAHAAGVIHRDLKPENIMISPSNGEPDLVKVLDFGIAKILAAGDKSLTRTGFVCGTPEYMSPEQGQGLAVDARSDLYAVGVVMYQCATGILPFEADVPLKVAFMHSNVQPTPPRKKNPRISAGLEIVILKALEKNPDSRYACARDFRRDLLLLEQDEKVSSSNICLENGKESKRNTSLIDISAESEFVSETPAENPAKKKHKLLMMVVCLLIAVGFSFYFMMKKNASLGIVSQMSEKIHKIFKKLSAEKKSATHYSNESKIAETPHLSSKAKTDRLPSISHSKSKPRFQNKPQETKTKNTKDLPGVASTTPDMVTLTEEKTSIPGTLPEMTKEYKRHPSAALAKHIALFHMRNNDYSSAEKWLERYLVMERRVDSQYVESFLRRQESEERQGANEESME